MLPSFIDQVIFCSLRDILGEDPTHSFQRLPLLVKTSRQGAGRCGSQVQIISWQTEKG